MTFLDLRVLSFLAVIGAAAGDCGNRKPVADVRIPKAVRLVEVESSTDEASTAYSAVIAPDAQVTLTFRVSGYVVEISSTKDADGRRRALEPGAALPSGATLARIRPSDYQAAVDKAQGARDESMAGIRAAEANLMEAQAAFTLADADYGRLSALWQQESLTKPAYDGAKAKLDAARAKVDAATAAIAAATQRSNAATAQLHEAEIALADTELHAPFDGILVDRHVDLGALVSPATPAFTVADLRRVKVRFSVPDTALQLFRSEQLLPVFVDAFSGERFQGRVLSVAPAADPKSRSFEITVAIDNPTLKLRSGMIASIRVATDTTARPQLRIPIDALVHDPTRDQYLVYTVEQKGGQTAVRAIYIRPGPLAGNQVSVVDGLTAGQRIIASGANLLRSGDLVKEIQ